MGNTEDAVTSEAWPLASGAFSLVGKWGCQQTLYHNLFSATGAEGELFTQMKFSTLKERTTWRAIRWCEVIFHLEGTPGIVIPVHTG